MNALTIAAFQWGSWPGQSQDERRTRLRRILDSAAGLGADLVVLPRLAGPIAFGAEPREGHLNLAECVRTQEAQDLFWSSLARETGMALVAGSTIVQRESDFMEAATMYAGDGRRAGESVRLHVGMEPGLTGGSEVRPIDFGGTRIGFVIGADAWSPEQCRILALMGCDILLSIQAMPEPHNPWAFVAGLWQNVQQNQVFGVEACLAGNGFAGRSAAYGPCDMAAGFSGFLIQAPDSEGDSLVHARLVPEALDRARREFPIFEHFNRRLYCREFPGAFERGGAL